MVSADRKILSHKARIAVNGHTLAKMRNTVNKYFSVRPKGPSQKTQFGVVTLEKGIPFPTGCALTWVF